MATSLRPREKSTPTPWSHHLNRGTHRALVRSTCSGLFEGAEPYLRSLANRKDVVARLRTALAQWEEAQSSCVSLRDLCRIELTNHKAPLRPLHHAQYLRRFIHPGGRVSWHLIRTRSTEKSSPHSA
jgi:hypothetical protein